MKFIATLLVAASLIGGGLYYKETATVTVCHDEKFLWFKTGETCVTEKKFQ